MDHPYSYPIEPFTKALAALQDDAVPLIKELQATPVDSAAIERARVLIWMIRDGLATEKHIRVWMRGLRDELITAVYIACPQLTLAELARDSGIGDSLISRIAERNGAAPRTVRERSRPGTP